MLDVTPSGLYEEIRNAEAVRDESLRHHSKLLEAYEGKIGNENIVFEWVANNMPAIIFENPRIVVKTVRHEGVKLAAEATQYAANRWIQMVQLRGILSRMFLDWGLGSAMAKVVSQPAPWRIAQDRWRPSLPRMYRIPPRQQIIDPYCASIDEARFVGDLMVIDHDVLTDPAMGFDQQLVGNLAIDSNLEKLERVKGGAMAPRRGEVLLYNVLVPEYQVDPRFGPAQGYHGTMFTLAAAPDGEAGFVRKPQPYYGPPSGPYAHFPLFPRGCGPWPLTPLQATSRAQKNLLDHDYAVTKSARQYKRIVLVDAANPKLAKTLAREQHNFVVPIRGLKKDQVINVEIGGVTPAMVQHLAMARQTFNRTIGMHPVQQGQLGDADSATEVSVADEAAQGRTGFLRRQFADGVRDSMGIVCWFLWHDSRMVIFLGEDAGEAFSQPEPLFIGGIFDPEQEGSYESLEFEVEPYSMPRIDASTQQRQALDMTTLVADLSPLVATIPWVDWKLILKKLGEANNDPDFGRVINVDMARQAGGAGGIPSSADVVPRLRPTGGQQGVMVNGTSRGRAGTRAGSQRGGGGASGGGGGGRRTAGPPPLAFAPEATPLSTSTAAAGVQTAGRRPEQEPV